MTSLPGAVLFTCHYNRVRSAMAEAVMKQHFGDRVFVDSCGLEPFEDDGPDPFVVAVMAEIGLDVSGHQPKQFDAVDADAYDLVVSLTPESQHHATELGRGHAVEIEYWATPDPTEVTGSRDQMLEAYRALRDSLIEKIEERFGGAKSAVKQPRSP